MKDTAAPVTWEQVLAFARRIEDAASKGHVPPEDGAKLVGMVLDFHGTVSTRRPTSNGRPPTPDEDDQR